ncbi:hypothetical protein R3P38DRAFT_2968417 [Favolaschia claudopus]|uniref:Uncharacterized protein n=1 Tax=Favolaschia claudopus TaxID=2862362 RepID=A0AAW0B301_9AGAR
MSSSPAFLYRLVYTLSLAHLASALATVFVYDIEDARYSQFIAILYSLATFYIMFILIPDSNHRENDPLSRLNKEYVFVNFLAVCWTISLMLVPLTVESDITITLSKCARRRFLSPKCFVIGLDMTLPFALIITLGLISYGVYRSGCELHAARARQSTTMTVNARPFTPFKLRPTRPLRVGSSSSSRENTETSSV